jgi:hypothetical protein
MLLDDIPLNPAWAMRASPAIRSDQLGDCALIWIAAVPTRSFTPRISFMAGAVIIGTHSMQHSIFVQS